MALRDKPGALIDACIHLAITDDLHMQFDMVIIKYPLLVYYACL